MTLYYHDADHHSASIPWHVVPWHVVSPDGGRFVAACGLEVTRIGATAQRETWPDGARCSVCEGAQ